MLLAIKLLSVPWHLSSPVFPQYGKGPFVLQKMVPSFNDFCQFFSALRRPLFPPVNVPCSWHFSSTRAMCLFHSGFHCCIKIFSFILLVHRLCGNSELRSTAQHSSLCFCGPWAGCAPEQPYHRKNSLRVTVN